MFPYQAAYLQAHLVPPQPHADEAIASSLERSAESFCSSNSALSFFSAAASTGITIPYPHITLHAVSRQPAPSSTSSSEAQTNGAPGAAATAGACIYCQLEESEEIAEEEEGGEMREMWITPVDEASGAFLLRTLKLTYAGVGR